MIVVERRHESGENEHADEHEMVKVKVCGITSLLDAEKSLELGADMLGFNFYPPSPRAIAPEKAREIIERLPPESFNVALFVNAARENVKQTIAYAEPVNEMDRQAYSALQFHGEESADYCRGWDLQVIKAFRLKEKASLAALADFSAGIFICSTRGRRVMAVRGRRFRGDGSTGSMPAS